MFRAAAVAPCDGVDRLRDRVIGAFDSREFDPARLVGEPTSSVTITEKDAEVMRKFWAGPTRATGESIWYGLGPGTESWGRNAYGHGQCLPTEAGDARRPVLNIAESWFGWVARDPGLDLASITFERFEELFDRGVRGFAELATDDPDLSGLRARAGKLILSVRAGSSNFNN